MKKHFGILLLTIASISLGGCDFISVGHEKALERIDDISENYVYSDKVQSLQTRSVLEITTESKHGDEVVNEKFTVYSLTKVFTTINFVYFKLSFTDEDLVAGTKVVNATEIWTYKRGNNFYLVSGITKNNEETNTYTVEKSTKEIKEKFEKTMKDQIFDSLNGEIREDAVDSTRSIIVKDKDQDLDTKYVTYGKGNLSVTFSMEENSTNDGTTYFSKDYKHYEWKRYSLKSSHTLNVLSTTEENSGDYSKITTESTYSFKTFFLPGYPRLRKYTKQ